MRKHPEPGGGVPPAPDPLVTFVQEVARRRGIELDPGRAKHVVAAAVRMSRGANAGELRVGIVLLEQLREELAHRGR